MAKAKAKQPLNEEDGVTALTQPLSKKAGRTRKNDERRMQLGRELALEIDALRGALTEMLDGYRLKIDADLLQLSSAARGETPFDTKPHRLPLAATQKMLKRIREVQIKAKKGRPKDFQRLQRLVEDLNEQMPPEK